MALLTAFIFSNRRTPIYFLLQRFERKLLEGFYFINGFRFIFITAYVLPYQPLLAVIISRLFALVHFLIDLLPQSPGGNLWGRF